MYYNKIMKIKKETKTEIGEKNRYKRFKNSEVLPEN